MSTVIDLVVLMLVLGMTYALTSEGLWGAALAFFNTLFAALIAFNFYEPVAQLLVENASFMANFADLFALMILFIVPLFLFRLATETLAPAMVRFPTPVYHLGRLVFGAGASVVMMAMVILAFEVAPVQKKMLGVFDYSYKPFYGVRFDRDFLAFFQYSSGYTFARNGAGSAGDSEFPARPMLFDPRAEWLMNHQQARPYGTEAVLPEPPGEAAATPAAGTGASGQGQGGPQGQGQGGPQGQGPGGPQGQGGRPQPPAN